MKIIEHKIWNYPNTILSSKLTNERTKYDNDDIEWYLGKYGWFRFCAMCGNWYELKSSNPSEVDWNTKKGWLNVGNSCLGNDVEIFYQNNGKDKADLTEF